MGGRLQRIALAAAAAFVTVNIWTGAPLLALWVGSQAVGSSGLSMAAVGIVVVVLVALVVALTALLTRINHRYDELTGRVVERRVQPWMRSMRGEREGYVRARQGVNAIERVVTIVVAAAMLLLNVWFFFFAGSPLA